MKISLPKSDNHSMVEVTLKHAKGSIECIRLDDSHKSVDIDVPEDTEVSLRYVMGSGQVDPKVEPTILKAAVAKPAPAPKPAPFVKRDTVPVEPKVEAKVEAKAEDNDE